MENQHIRRLEKKKAGGLVQVDKGLVRDTFCS
jgi:hypothetical protein